MKITTSFSILFVACLLAFSSCKNSQESCQDIEYNQSFVAEEGDLFCLPDGNEVHVKELINSFCPCNEFCVWGGEWLATIDFTISNQSISDYEFHGHPTAENEELSNDLSIIAHSFEYEEECTQSNPSPPIKSVVLEIRMN